MAAGCGSAELDNRIDDPNASDSSLQINEMVSLTQSSNPMVSLSEAISQTDGVQQVKRVKILRATKSWGLSNFLSDGSLPFYQVMTGHCLL